MDQNEDTKSDPVQNQPDALQQESPRKCKICGGPNHQGCGCEARQRAAAVQVETENINKELIGPQPAEPKPAETAESKKLSAEELVALKRADELFGHVEAMSDNVIDFCGNVLTVISYLANIDQHLKEIHAMVKARIRSDADKNKN